MLSKDIRVKQQTCGLCYDHLLTTLRFVEVFPWPGKEWEEHAKCMQRWKEQSEELGMVSLICDANTWEAEARWDYRLRLCLKSISREVEEGKGRRRKRGGTGDGNVEGEYYECSSSGQLENLLEGVSEIIEGVFPITGPEALCFSE